MSTNRRWRIDCEAAIICHIGLASIQSRVRPAASPAGVVYSLF